MDERPKVDEWSACCSCHLVDSLSENCVTNLVAVSFIFSINLSQLTLINIILQKAELMSTFITVVSDGSFQQVIENVPSIDCVIIITIVHFLDRL